MFIFKHISYFHLFICHKENLEMCTFPAFLRKFYIYLSMAYQSIWLRTMIKRLTLKNKAKINI